MVLSESVNWYCRQSINWYCHQLVRRYCRQSVPPQPEGGLLVSARAWPSVCTRIHLVRIYPSNFICFWRNRLRRFRRRQPSQLISFSSVGKARNMLSPDWRGPDSPDWRANHSCVLCHICMRKESNSTIGIFFNPLGFITVFFFLWLQFS